MNSKPAWACALSTFIVAGTAHAQAAPPQWYPPQYLAHISIQASPSTELEVLPSGERAGLAGSPAIAHCTEYCDFWAYPGKYTLYARDHSNGEHKDLSLHIKQSSRYTLEPGDDGARTTGLVLGIGGAAAVITGFIMIGPLVMSSMCEGGCSTKAEEQAAAIGLGLLIAGAIATPVGWSMYVHNRTRLKRIDERAYQATETTNQLRLGVVGVGLGGLGFGGALTF